MNKLIMTLGLVAICCGCASQRDWYKGQGWTPDGFSYTLQRDRKTGDLSDYWGLNWSLK